jgi:hypothetical protein
MSKVNLKLSYKNCCIVKHTLEAIIELNEEVLSEYDNLKYVSDEDLDGFDTEQFDKDKVVKELEEEKRALKSIAEQIKNWKERINHG